MNIEELNKTVSSVPVRVERRLINGRMYYYYYHYYYIKGFSTVEGCR